MISFTDQRQVNSSTLPYSININDCFRNETVHINISDTEGLIKAFTGTKPLFYTKYFTACSLQIRLLDSKSTIVFGEFEGIRNNTCNFKTVVLLNDNNDFSYGHGTTAKGTMICKLNKKSFTSYNSVMNASPYFRAGKTPLVILKGNILHVHIDHYDPDFRPPNFWIHFKTTKENLLEQFHNKSHEIKKGKLLLPGYRLGLDYPPGINATYLFHTDIFHVFMISVPFIQICYSETANKFQMIHVKSKQNMLKLQKPSFVETGLFNSNILVQFSAKLFFDRFVQNPGCPLSRGVVVRYSYHLKNESITQIKPGVFNCTGGYYSAFSQHLACNVRAECVGGEDETEICPYYSQECPRESLYVAV